MTVALALVLLLVLAVIAWGVGQAGLMRFLKSEERLERTVFALALGLGTLAYLVLALGLLKLARPTFLWGAAGTVGALALALVRPQLTWRKPKSEESGLGALLIAAGFGLVGLATLFGTLMPPTQWDELAYHLAVPKVFLREGRIFYIPYDHHSNFPFTLQMLYLLMLSAGSVLGAKLVHSLCGLLLVLAVAAFCKRHFGGGGAVAAGVLLASPLVLWEATTAYIDLGSALFVWLGFHALVNATEPPPAPREAGEGVAKRGEGWLLLSALCMGFALGTKATVLGFWGLCLLGILGWNLITERKWARETLSHAALWGSVSLGVGAIWYVKSWLFAGNPVYPFGYSVLGGRYWSAQNAAQYAAEQSKFGFGKGLGSLLLSPVRVSFEHFFAPPAGRAWSFTEQAMSGIDLGFVWLLALIPAALVVKKLPRPAVYAGLFAGGIWAFWFLTMQQGRYLIPALPCFAVVAGGAFSVSSKPIRAGMAALITLGVGWSVWSVSTARLDRVPDLIAACESINAGASSTEKVALFDEVRGYYLNREYVWAQPDHAEGLIPWDSYKNADDWLLDFKKRGYTVFLCGPSGGDDGRRWRQLFAEALSGDKIILTESFGRFKVYRVP